MSNVKTISVPLGRISDYKAAPDADLYLVKPGKRLFEDDKLIRFASRAALEAFNKKAGLRPLVFTQVPIGMVVWAHQSDSEARAALTRA